MTVQVTIKSYREERQKEIMDDLESKMERVGLLVENQAKENISKSPPEHPQVQTGLLRSSITHEVEKSDNEVSTIIGTNIYYGKYLELGTIYHPSYSWLFPAVELNQDKIKQILISKGFTAELRANIE